jgi:RNA polymerase sigma factor (sigma-70 family)
MPELHSGIKNKKRWIAGDVPMKHGVLLYVDTRDGTGVCEVLKYLTDFISYQATKVTIPFHSVDDVVQELNTLALAAIPEYDASKKANMLTFVQNHIRNRLVNIYKFTTEQRRTAVHGNFRYCKIKCPKCTQYSVFDEIHEVVSECENCGHKRQDGDKWKKYPVPIATISANELFSLPDGSETSIQDHCSYGDLSIFGGPAAKDESSALNRVVIETALDRYDSITKDVALRLTEGYSVSEIAKDLNCSDEKIKIRMRRLSKNRELTVLFAEYSNQVVLGC